MISIFLSKFLGFIYRMQFVRLTGEETVGIYMTAYPAFIFSFLWYNLVFQLQWLKLLRSYAQEVRHRIIFLLCEPLLSLRLFPSYFSRHYLSL